MSLCLYVKTRTRVGGGGHDIYAFIDGFMKAHPNAGGLAVHWCIFGSNGHVTKPEGGVLENYTMRSKDTFSWNSITKTICDPIRVLGFPNPHIPHYCKGFSNLDENGEIVKAAVMDNISYNLIRINHYFGKSKEEYIAKRARGLADGLGLHSMQEFDTCDQNIIHDTEILSYM